MNPFKKIILTAITAMVCIVLISLIVIWIMSMTKNSNNNISESELLIKQWSSLKLFRNTRQVENTNEQQINNQKENSLLSIIANNMPPLL